MYEASAGQVCRLVVVGPSSRVDLSVPVHVPFADLLPTLLRSLGTDLADRGLEHSGWVLQRLGEPPLDEDSTTEDLDLVDGDVVHLRPRSEQIPPLDFDDLVDGVATGMRNRSGLWRPETTRNVSLNALGFWLLCALVVPLLAGPAGVRALTAAGASLILLAGAVAGRRSLRDPMIARIFAFGAVAFAIEAGALGATWYGSTGMPSGAGPVFAGTVLAVTVAVAALFLVMERGSLGPPGLAVGLVGGMTLIGGLLRSSAELTWPQIAAVVLVMVIALRPSIPLLSFKFAGMVLPQLPVEPEDLQKDVDPEPGKTVLDATVAADLYMTAMHLACGVVSAVVLFRLGSAPGTLPIVATVLGCLAQLLAVRPMTSAWHRLALGIPAAFGMATAALTVATRVQPAAGRLVVLAVILLLAAASAGVAHTMPRRRLTPIWGRVGDWGQTLTVVALIPVVLGILGAFSLVRRLVG
jgi:type VII secretion integral membrane protein EccD